MFDACFNYVVAKDRPIEQPEKAAAVLHTDKVKELKIDTSSFAVPDSTEKLKKAPLPDSTEKLKKALLPDTTKKSKETHLDSLKIKAKQDSIKHIQLMEQDSTARLEYFRYHRDDSPSVPFRDKKPSSFFVRPSEGFLTKSVQLDSTGTKVTIKEMLGGQPYRTYLEMPLAEYIKLRLKAISRDVWENKAYEYKLKSSKKDLNQVISDITNIDIPLPSTPLLSIFGPPKINLKIGGQVDIHGAWRNETTTGITSSALGNTRNEPDFKQQVQINLNGTIGDKLTLGADWNTERQFQYENQLKIKYTGYEDEIIQSIEAGNVSLETSPLVGGSEALFGIKAKFKMGPFSLTALASQKKSEIKEVSVTSGSQTNNFEIHAYSYSPNHFFIDSVYLDPKLNVFSNYYNNPVPRIIDSLRVKDIEVWKTATGIVDLGKEKLGNAFINLPRRKVGQLYAKTLRDTTLASQPGTQVIGRWVLLQPSVDYDLHPETGFITFRTQIQDQDAIAVAYRLEGPTNANEDDEYQGEFVKDLQGKTDLTTGLPFTRLVLKLVKPPNLQPQFKQAWKLQLRNIYPVGGRDVKQEGFQLDIKYRVEGQEPTSDYQGTKLLQAFGLDKTDPSRTSTQPDGSFDFFPNRTILPATGEIVFPVLQPFGKDFPKTLPDSLKYQSIYDTTVTFAQQDRSKDKFLITGQYSASVSSVYNIGFNVVENSVKIYLAGNQLKEGIDYTVDYNMGQIQIRNDKALLPGADLRITYEQNDLFQLASKTLLGFRGLYEFNKETTLGFSFLNLNQQTLSDKVRIGEEPLNNSLFGLDFKTNINLPFITKTLSKIINTSAPSNLAINAEYAYIKPDPNTKKSTISSDNGNSIAYIDDFEGAKRLIPLGMGYSSWHDISVPLNMPNLNNQAGEDQMPYMNYKGKAWWYNITPSDVLVSSIYGNRKRAVPGQDQIQALDLIFDPSQRGAYNYNLSKTDPNYTQYLTEPIKSWAGIMKVLSSTANNLIDQNIGFIEFWMHVSQAPSDLKLHIDLGQISEDVIPNGRLDTEDKNSNYLVDNGEDTGIDGVFDKDEPGYDPVNNPDPANDDYSFQLTQNADYSHINGGEGNAVSLDQGKLPDTEDLNGNSTLDRVNSYYEYEVPIDTNKLTNKFIQGGGDNAGWYLFRIPLKDFKAAIGNPSFSVVEFIRFWVEGSSTQVHLRFADMNLVGNQWQKVLNPPKITLQDTVMTVSTVSIEDNPEYYSPPGVQRELDRTQPNYTIYKNEQSLNLVLNKLEDGDSREVVRYMIRPLDLFNYKQLKFFIHGDMNDTPGSVSHYESPTNYGSEIYLRFGADSLNYYEYRQPVKADWNEVALTFSELTALKLRRSSDSSKTMISVPVPGEPGHTFGVLGNPTLTRVSYFLIGIVNPRDKGVSNEPVSGSVWVNELRVIQADQTPGWAYNANASLSLADLMKVSANISKTNPFFHKLNDRFGTRDDNMNWGIAVDFDLLKLIPANLAGSNLRISYSRTEQSTNPLYIPGTDISIADAQTEIQRSMTEKNASPAAIDSAIAALKNNSITKNVSESWTLSNIKFKVLTDLWYIRDIINNLSFGFNYNKTTGQSPTTTASSNWQWNANANYSINLSRDLYFKPADIPIIGSFFNLFSDYRDLKIYYAPQTFTSSLTATRRRSFTQVRAVTTVPSVQRDFTATRGAGFTWQLTEGGFWNLSLNYNFNVSSTLAYLLADSTTEKPEGQIWRAIFGGQFFGRDFLYKQSVDLRASPRLPSIFDLNRYITLNSSYSSSYSWQNNFQQGVLGKSAGYSNRLSLGFTVRLKSIFAPLFVEEPPKVQQRRQPELQQHQPAPTGGRRSGRGAPRNIQNPIEKLNGTEAKGIVKDSMLTKQEELKIAEKDSVETPSKIMASLEYLKLFFKTILFDYDVITINFNQTSTYTGGGLVGDGTGFNNFWGFSQSSSKGPNRLFMLGLSNDLGPRAPNGNLQDNYSQKNDIDFKTSKPLWEGAQLDLTWKIGWGINRSTTLQTDSLGNVKITNVLSTGTIDRSFLSLPPTFFLSFFGNGIKKVHDLYDPNASDPNSSLSNAFLKGFETFSFIEKIPILSKFFRYIPRPNWTFTWSGLEQYSIFSFAKRVTINHAYVSNYSEGWKINPDGFNEIQSQRVDYGFSPLIGITMNFDKFFEGSFQGTVRYSAKTSYSLGLTTHNVTEGFTKDINISASYLKSGFDLPLFGISLKNDLEISFSYTSARTSSVIYEMDNWKDAGTPQEGKTSTTIEPKIKYVMSSRVTLSIFYRRTSIEPEGASRIPPTTTNEAGVDVRISIQ